MYQHDGYKHSEKGEENVTKEEEEKETKGRKEGKRRKRNSKGEVEREQKRWEKFLAD